MISIIICSRKPDISESLKDNITDTIGVDFELIVIDNSNNKYSIFQAYNEGVCRAKYSYFCFMHEDILYHTNDWGKKVIAHFKDERFGIIGVAGSHYIPKLPGSQWSSHVNSANILHTIDGKSQLEKLRFINNDQTSLNAVSIDGLWFCLSESVIDKIRFDDVTFVGFHCYDTDICLQIYKLKFEVRIVFDINIEHFSMGVRDRKWLENLLICFKKWKNDLPISVVELSDIELSEANYLNAREMIEQMRINKFGLLGILLIWYYYFRTNPPTNKRNIKYCMSLLKRTIH